MYRVPVLCVIVLTAAVGISCVRSNRQAPAKRSGNETRDTAKLPEETFPCACPQSAPLCQGSVLIESAADPIPDPTPVVLPPMAAPPSTPTLDRLVHMAARDAYKLRHGVPAPGCMPTRWVLSQLR